MSNLISNVFVAEFDADVKQQYQGMMRLYDTIRRKNGVVGSTYNFPRIDKGLATPRLPQADVTPINLNYAQNTATIEDWNAPEYTDIFNQQKVNFDDRAELVEAVSYAIGRRMDQIIIDTGISGAGATVPDTIQPDGTVGASSVFNLGKLRRAKRLMDADGVPQEGRHFAHSANCLEDALAITEMTSADFNTIRALVQGDLDTYLGYHFHMINDRAEGGLPISANIRQNLCYHDAAIGLAVGIDMNTKIDWVAEKTSWLVNAMFAAGAVVIDNPGVVRLDALEN